MLDFDTHRGRKLGHQIVVNGHNYLLDYLTKWFTDDENNIASTEALDLLINCKDKDNQSPLILALKNKRVKMSK